MPDTLPVAPLFTAGGQPQSAQGVFIIDAGPSGEPPAPQSSDTSRGGFSATTRMLDFENGQYLDLVAGQSELSAPLNCEEVFISPSVPVMVRIATGGAEAGANSGSAYIPAVPYYLQCNPGDRVSIAPVDGAGFVTVLPVL